MNSFEDFGLHPALLRAVKDLGYEQPTPIQAEAIPPVMQGRDVIGCAMTGSGKTAAFLLPILHRLQAQKHDRTRVLIVAPTRELAIQIDESREELGRHLRATGAAIYGGVGMAPQERAFRNRVEILVATPGRLLDHLQYPYASLDDVDVLVLDEADRMLDMGFLPDIRRILRRVPAQRQTLLFSATMPAPIAELAKEMMKDPVRLNLQRQAAPATGITQSVYPVPQTLKSPLLAHLLKTESIHSVVAFTRTKHRADRLAAYLQKQGIEAARIHGNRSQGQRTEALAGFKNGQYRVLVATDIAARGIDIDALSHVVNFDVPHVPDDYIHRVGRTARAEAEGDAFTFVSPEEEVDLRAIEKALGNRIARVQAPGFDYHSAPKEQPETPIAERIAAIRAEKAAQRARAAEKAARRAAAEAAPAPRPRPAAPAARRSGGGRPSPVPRPVSGSAAPAFRPIRRST